MSAILSSNPMTIFVTFHGGSPTTSIPEPIQYVVSYTIENNSLQSTNPNALNLPILPSGEYNELRDLQLAIDGNFYLVNSYKNVSQVWQIPGTGLEEGTGPVVFTSGT